MCCACGGGTAACTDLNFDGEEDKGGDSCQWYNEHREDCGKYDDEDFNATEMCCVCGGGSASGSLGHELEINLLNEDDKAYLEEQAEHDFGATLLSEKRT